jgi:phosphoribosylanthranilate isomerase
VGPWAIDVSSGVEASPGIKNPASLTALFDAIGTAMQEAR